MRDNRLTNVQYGADSRKVSYAYDSVGRVASRSTQNGTLTRTTTYNYLAGNSALTNATTPLVSSITQYGMNFSYTYDAVGNITSETRNGLTTTYSYDNLGQLTRVNDPHDTTSGSAGTTWVYAYDLGGNITSKKRYAYTTGTLGTVLQTISYGYTDSNWKDKLTSYDGMTIDYDAIGNITGYNDMMFVWGAGRRLGACMANGMILFGYDSQGERIRKFAAGVATLYTMHGKLLTHLTKGSDSMHFYYDANSRPAMVDYNGTHYTYLHNLQGDVVGLVDSANSIVVEYKYDAWGKLLSTTGTLASTLGYLNPFRYRCYIYDEETGLYYVSSRYYDPEIGRWINADGQISGVGGDIRGYNLFAYCFNNPVNMIDPTGNWPSWGQVFAAVATVAVAAVFVAAVVASAVAVGVAAGVAAASIGATGTMVSAAITVGTVGTYAVAAGIGACALSNAGEIFTGTNVIRDGLMGGNQEAYDTVQTALNIAGGGAMIIGQTTPGVTGNAAKPNKNAQSVHKVPTTGTANTSFDKLYAGKAGDFQRTYYDFRGNMSLQIDFTNHNSPSAHSNPHLHTFWLGKRQPPINMKYLK